MKKTLIVLLGPTGVGKTNIGIRIGQHLNAEIVSADSRQIYKEIEIGTATPSASQLNAVKHHFVKSRSIHDYYNASMYEMEVLELLEKIFESMDYALLIGGSGLYIDAVCHGIDDFPMADPEIRSQLREKFEKEGIASLRRQLKILDPEYYNRVDLRNPKRIMKALEISMMTGKPYSSYLTNKSKERQFHIIKIGLARERDELYDILNKRVDRMVEEGLIAETKSVYRFRGLNPLNTVGYNELFDHFDGKYTRSEAIELIKRNTRRYAKRQISWFSRYKDISWFNPPDPEKIISFIIEKVKN